jgi:hypothetical protein
VNFKRLADFVVIGLTGKTGRYLVSPRWETEIDGCPGVLTEICGLKTDSDPCLFVCLVRDPEKIVVGLEADVARLSCKSLLIPANPESVLARGIYLPQSRSSRFRKSDPCVSVVLLRTNCGLLDVEACGAVEFVVSDEDAISMWSSGDPVVIFRDRPEYTQ